MFAASRRGVMLRRRLFHAQEYIHDEGQHRLSHRTRQLKIRLSEEIGARMSVI